MFSYRNNPKFKRNLERPKTRSRILLVALLLSFVTAGVLFYQKNNSQISAVVKEIIPPEPAPLPTEINANFMTQVNQCFLPTAEVYGYILRITSGFRSFDEQDELYEQGRTINGHIVTEAPAGKSIHNYGYAVDVVDRWNGFEIDWERLGRIGHFCSLEQADEGDLPHFENRGGLVTDQFKAGLRPPDLSLPCPLMAEKYAKEEKLTRKDLELCGAPNFNIK